VEDGVFESISCLAAGAERCGALIFYWLLWDVSRRRKVKREWMEFEFPSSTAHQQLSWKVRDG